MNDWACIADNDGRFTFRHATPIRHLEGQIAPSIPVDGTQQNNAKLVGSHHRDHETILALPEGPLDEIVDREPLLE
jgi:hypothetical protein